MAARPSTDVEEAVAADALPDAPPVPAPIVGYRVPAPIAPANRALDSFELAARPREVQRAIAITRLICLGVALVTYFLPWHLVLVGRLFSDEPTGESFTCTGWSHQHATLLFLLVLVLPIAQPIRRRVRLKAALALHLGTLCLLLVAIMSMLFSMHLFDFVYEIPAGTVFGAAVAWLFFGSLFGLIYEPILYVWQRGRLPPPTRRGG
jgi:hypothetical protein